MLDILACSIGGVNFAAEANQMLPGIINLLVNGIKIFVPIILVIFGMIDLAKAVMSNDEKEMKGAQTKLIKRAIYAIAVFLVFSIVQVVVSVVGESDDGAVKGCLNCFINKEC